MPLPSFGRQSSRTTSKSANDRRRREPAKTSAEPPADDHELSSYLAALAPESAPESTGSGRRFGEAQVYQLRMNHIAGQQLKDLATERGTSPQALALEWVLERLSWESQGSADRLQQNAHDPEEPITDEFVVDRTQWDRPVRGSLR